MENQVAAQPRQRNAPSPLSKGELINELSACLALVRPVTMSEDMATEWLAVAAGEVARMNPSAFKAGCAEARRECTHHGQIVPTILNGKEAKWYRSIDRLFLAAPRESAPQLTASRETQKLIEQTTEKLRP